MVGHRGQYTLLSAARVGEDPESALPWNADIPTSKVTNEIIAAAILGFEAQKRHLESQIADLRALQTGASTGTAAAPEPPKKRRGRMSAAGRKAIAEAQRKRWAESKAASAGATPKVVSKPKRKLPAAGRKAVIAALKKRWALKRTEAAKAK
jgi:hypothetical protein